MEPKMSMELLQVRLPNGMWFGMDRASPYSLATEKVCKSEKSVDWSYPTMWEYCSESERKTLSEVLMRAFTDRDLLKEYVSSSNITYEPILALITSQYIVLHDIGVDILRILDIGRDRDMLERMVLYILWTNHASSALESAFHVAAGNNIRCNLLRTIYNTIASGYFPNMNTELRFCIARIAAPLWSRFIRMFHAPFFSEGIFSYLFCDEGAKTIDGRMAQLQTMAYVNQIVQNSH